MLGQLNQQRLLIVSILFLFAFLILAVSRFIFEGINFDVNAWSASINSGFFLFPAQGLSLAFDATALAIASLTIAVFLIAKKRGHFSLLLLVAMAGDLALVELSKNAVASLRPANEVFSSVGYSFPSGHVTGAVVFFGILTYFAWVHWSSLRMQIATTGMYGAVVAVVGFDRIFLNVHWLSDVIGAVFLGAFWVSACILLFKQTCQFGLAKGR